MTLIDNTREAVTASKPIFNPTCTPHIYFGFELPDSNYYAVGTLPSNHDVVTASGKCYK